MPIRRTWRNGEHLVACERCGQTYYSSQIRKEWTGAMVCYGPGTRNDWEPRHPVDFIRSRQDLHGVRDARTRSISHTDRVNTVLYWMEDYTDDDFGNDKYVSP